MRFDFTISGSAGEVDLRVESATAPALRELRADLALTAGLPEDAALHAAGRVVDEQTLLGSASLRSGSLLTTQPGCHAGAATAYTLQVLSGPAAGAGHALHRGEVSIGRSGDCDVVLADDRVSRRHATMSVGLGSLALRDHGSTNGTTVDGVEVPASGTELRPGPVIRIGDSLLAVVAPAATAASVVERGDTVLVHRAARQRDALAAATIDRPDRAEAPRPRPIQWIGALLPALASGGIAWATGSTLFLVFGLLSPVMLMSTALGDRVHWRRSRRRAGAEFRQVQQRAAAEIEAALAAETDRRRVALPDPPTVALIAATPGTRLWERRSADDDWLSVRVGSAALSSATRVRTGSSSRPAGMLRAVPVAVDLRPGPLGIAGPPHLVAGLARWIVAQLTTSHSPAEVEVALVLSPETVDRWAWARWLPHVRRAAACTPETRSALLRELTAEVEHRRRTREPSSSRPRQWTVLVVDTADAVEIAGLGMLESNAGGLGLTGVYVGRDRGCLPSACGVMLSVAGESGSRVLIEGGGTDGVDAALDSVSGAWADALARALAPLADADGPVGTHVPDECSLLDILGVPDLDIVRFTRGWEASSGRPDTFLGVTGDGPLRIDLDSDGPHALIAGTTGAGKSQLLRTLVAGLAVRHPPDELTVLLIDYKGGAAFAECAALPHCAGLVTDLDPHLTRRALRSLEAELRRRERLFNDAGVADLGAYRRARPDAPVPRLVIVVDEFATLADELPDFVPGLVGVAQRGRSLGIHLVLATQRPGSVVSPEIKANTSLRIALRVTDVTESLGIIDAADAATITASTPGRAYLRSGPDLRCFQAARVTSPVERRPEVPSVVRLDGWRRPPREQAADDEHGLSDLVGALCQAARARGAGPAASPWLPALPAVLAAAETEPVAGTVTFGRLDLPATQAQPPLVLCLDAPSSTLLVGGPRSGRTTGLASIALGAAVGWPVDDLEIHVVDPVGDLVGLIGALPHIGTCVGPGQDAMVATLLDRLAAGGLAAGPQRLLLIDSWETLRAGQDDTEAARCQHLLAALLRSAPGVSTVVAGDRTLTSPRVSGAFGSRLALSFADRSDYGALGIAVRDVPGRMPPGRGVRAVDAAEFQIAVPGIDPGSSDIDTDVSAALRHTAATLQPPSGDRREPLSRLQLRPLPRSLCTDDVAIDRRAASRPGSHAAPAVRSSRLLRIGLGGDAATPVLLDPFAGAQRWMVAGPPRSGRSSTLMTVLAEGRRLGLDMIVAAPPRSPLGDAARAWGVRLLTPATSEAGPVPREPTLLLVDDSETFLDADVSECLVNWFRDATASVAVLLAGRSDELAVAYRGLAAEIRRSRSGIALRPGPVDGELFGTRLPRAASGDPPGRGYLIADQAWSAAERDGGPVPIQVALCRQPDPISPGAGSDDRCRKRMSP